MYEELLKKEGEITSFKTKALQLMRTHEDAVGYNEMRQQLQQLGSVSVFVTVPCALIVSFHWPLDNENSASCGSLLMLKTCHHLSLLLK